MEESKNALLDQFRTYSDKRIQNTINQSYNFSQAHVEAATAIAKERDLLSKDYNPRKSISALDLATKMLENRIPIERIKNDLLAMGHTEDVVIEAITKAATLVDLNKEVSKQEDSKSYSWAWFLIVFIILRFARCAMNNN